MDLRAGRLDRVGNSVGDGGGSFRAGIALVSMDAVHVAGFRWTWAQESGGGGLKEKPRRRRRTRRRSFENK